MYKFLRTGLQLGFSPKLCDCLDMKGWPFISLSQLLADPVHVPKYLHTALPWQVGWRYLLFEQLITYFCTSPQFIAYVSSALRAFDIPTRRSLNEHKWIKNLLYKSVNCMINLLATVFRNYIKQNVCSDDFNDNRVLRYNR